MKRLLIIILILFNVASCKNNLSGKDNPDKTSSTAAPSCDPFVLTNDMVAATYTGTTVTTSGTCDNGGQEYIITTDSDYNPAGSATGWRLINSVLTTNAGSLNLTNGRFQTTDGVNEGIGLTFTGVNNTTCQAAYSVNGTSDRLLVQLTAEFDSNCVPRLRGTFREYAICADTNQVTICSGTIILER